MPSDTTDDAHPSPAPLTLTARGGGSWQLAVPGRQRWAAGWVQKLEVELLFPATAARAGAAPTATSPPSEGTLHRRRGRVRRAELCLEQETLNRALEAALLRLGGELPTALGTPLGIELCRVRIDGTEPLAGMSMLFLLGKGVVEPGQPSRFGTARLTLRRLPQASADLVVGISEVRLYGQSRTAAPLVGHTLLRLFGQVLLGGSRPEPPPVSLLSGAPALGLAPLSTPALSELRVELLHDALLALLPAAGYRVADPSTAPLYEAKAFRGRSPCAMPPTVSAAA